MKKRFFYYLLILAILGGCATPKTMREQAEPKEEIGEAPVIIDYYATEVIRPGDSWKVYLHAKDNDGDMKDIVSVLEQVGDVPYGACVSRIKKKDGREVAGYLFLKTPKDRYLFSDQFNLKVVVRDRQGNRSERVELPLRFGKVQQKEIPEKWEKAADRRLGAASHEIMSTQRRFQVQRQK